ncbi:MAG: hypothetical protein KDC31_07805 [Saprospiraceae bacterium]|mgnify:FL=1|jgi:hypothetical protein|nr:hypothetical protein [Saprospiraceae bacterium]MBX7178103.1 hypothetical protein [Saprospiraceae bacterium]MCB0591180.1 hypothetical protein [Saprospiraceae bacterium]MCC7147822.1 hypothetical protein [Saprospiraceae bacterium]MCO5282904.1 hypothetical protein [Saprospiraceae bacterium]
MKNTLLLTTILSFILIVPAIGQKVKSEGNLDFLKGVKEVTLAYKYDKMAVGKYKDGNEYVAKKTKELNEKEKGKGDDWAKKWVSDRSERFEPSFENLLSEYCKGIDFDQNNKSEYTMTLETVFTEPGFNVGVMRQNAYINVIVHFTDKAGKELATLSIDKIPGRDVFGYDFDTGQRIEEAYSKAGKTIGKYLTKKVE